jgi:hypothetical protein
MSVYATEIEDASADEVIETPEVSEPELSLNDVTFNFTYTSDSVVKEGLMYQVYSDPISGQFGVELVPNFGIGYAIYDDVETDIIDGIRINDAEVTSLRIPISADTTVFTYNVAVRTVYVDGASGTLAQILDGTYDYSQLLTNPIVVFQLVYWVIMALTAFVGFVIAIRNKGVKAKTSDEIASKVSEGSDAFRENIINVVTDVVKSEILPLAQASVKSGKEAVKAILLSNSKSKEAPSALLDIFSESSDIDISTIVDEVRETLSKSTSEHEAAHTANATALHSIANHVIQEDVSNATEIKSETRKSIF